MKKALFAMLFLFTTSAFASPFVISDPLAAGVTDCGVSVDGITKVYVPAVSNGFGQFICKYDVSFVGVGPHQITMTALAVDPVWGTLESIDSLPLDFTRPGIPVAPDGFGLQP